MAPFASPYAFHDLVDGESLSFRVRDWERGECPVTPRDTGVTKIVPCVRVHVPAEDKPGFPHYWDFTSSRLIAQLIPQLQRGDVRALRFTVTAHNQGLRRTYSLEIRRAP